MRCWLRDWTCLQSKSHMTTIRTRSISLSKSHKLFTGTFTVQFYYLSKINIDSFSHWFEFVNPMINGYICPFKCFLNVFHELYNATPASQKEDISHIYVILLCCMTVRFEMCCWASIMIPSLKGDFLLSGCSFLEICSKALVVCVCECVSMMRCFFKVKLSVSQTRL